MAIFGPRVGHEALFDEVCKYLEIDRKAKPLLQSVVKKYQMPRPAEIFILPDTLRRAMEDTEFSENNEELRKFHDAWFLEESHRSRSR